MGQFDRVFRMGRTTALSEPVRVWSGASMAQSASAAHVRCARKRQLATKMRLVVKGHFQTHALQQSRGGVEIADQAFSSSSNAFASFRSSVSKPSVNHP